MFWRSKAASKTYNLCKRILLPEGVLMSHDFDQKVHYILGGVFEQKCYEGTTPMLNTNVNMIMNTFSQPLPIVKKSWEQYTLRPNLGVFIYSVVPIVYSISISAVVTWFLTIFVITNYTIKPSILLKGLTVMSLIYMLITVIRAIVVLHGQQREGYLHGAALLDHLNGQVYLSVIDMIVVFFLQVNQVQVVMRLFSRQSDKRLIFLVGVLVSVASQTLWSITKFHYFSVNEEVGKIIPAFTYLTRIAMSISYAAMFTAFLLTKSRTLIAHRSIWLLLLLTVVFIYSPVAFFIADVSSAWVYELSEVFSVVTYVVCVVIPWEWCNKYNTIRRMKEKEGVLGRRFHEDELYELDRFELFVEEEDSDESNDNEQGNAAGALNNAHDNSLETNPENLDEGDQAERIDDLLDLEGTHLMRRNVRQYQKSAYNRMVSGISLARDRFLDITDKIIATGLAIPRSVSVGSNSAPHNFHYDSRGRDEDFRPTRAREATSIDDYGRTDREVFVYSTRDVVIDQDNALTTRRG